MKQFDRLLVIREDKLGDNCISLPVLEALLAISPNTRVTWACQPQWAALFEDHPLVNAVWGIPRKPKLLEQLRYARRIRKLKPDAVLLLRGRTLWKRIVRLAGVPIRAGNEVLRSPSALTHHGWDMLGRRYHESRRTLDVLSAALGIELGDYPARMHIEPAKLDVAQSKLSAIGVRQNYFAVQLGMGGTSLAIPTEFMAQVAKEVASQTDLIPVLTGSANECGLEKEFAQVFAGEFVSTIGKTNLTELAVLLKGARFILSVDTGTVHLGAALNVPSVVIMPKLQHSPQKWCPWMVQHKLIRPREFCSTCTLKRCYPGQSACTLSIEAESVVTACLDLLGDPKPLVQCSPDHSLR